LNNCVDDNSCAPEECEEEGDEEEGGEEGRAEGVIVAAESCSETVTGTYNTATGNYIGYGVVNYWMDINAADLAKQLSDNNLTITHVEFLGPSKEVEYYDNPNLLYQKFLTFVSEMRKKNITTFVNIINWNKGAADGKSICYEGYNDAWFSSILNFFVNQVGTEKIILQTASEWGGGRNSECDSKAQRWNDQMQQKWTGLKAWNRGSRPESAPSNQWFLEYHSEGVNDKFPKGSIVTTDTSSILVELSNNGNREGFGDPSAVEAYARKVHNCDTGFIYYGFLHKQIDSASIQAIGKVASMANLQGSIGAV
jgi:hypothetical protein